MQLKIRERLKSYKRVLTIAKKPTHDDFYFTAKICAIGMALIGVIGFLVYLIFILFV